MGYLFPQNSFKEGLTIRESLFSKVYKKNIKRLKSLYGIKE